MLCSICSRSRIDRSSATAVNMRLHRKRCRAIRQERGRVSIVLQENGQYYLEQVNNIDAPESERTPDYSVTGGLERWQTIENNLAVRFNLHKNVLTGLYRNSYYFRDLEVELENGSCVGHVGID